MAIDRMKPDESVHGRRKLSLFWSIGCLLAAVLSLSSPATSARSNRLDAFAKCLAEKNAVMYGSFLCPHCADQKDLFGDSFVYVKYVECSIPASRQMTQACANAKIKSVPTWIFADGQRRIGMVPLEELSERTGCKLP